MENLLSAVPVNRGDSLVGALRGRRYWRRDEEAAIARARALLDRFGLSGYADTYAGDLSGGQRRLTEIMRALMAEPAVLLLDEPMAGVHPRLARQIGAQLLGLCAEGMTILMVEHELAIMDEFCDPVIVMAEGTGRLSGGERKMLAMGRVLMLQPAVFLLDEPTANLAPKVAAGLLSEHVRTLAEAGAAVLIVEQRARAVLAISDYTYVLGGGQVLMADTPARLAASQEFTESFFGAVPQSPKG
jgi:ABC-type branched-subunit amino acid transport system ATPase component